MFTKKPERDMPGDALPRMTERPAVYAKSPSSSTLVPSIIGEDLTITGNVVSKGEIQVDGEIQGDVQCGSLLLGDKSQIIGGVIAEDIVVRGRVVGSIKGLRITLQAQSHVEGDIYHQSLAIEQGAYFEGKSRRSDDPLAASKSAATRPDSADKPAAAPERNPRVEPRPERTTSFEQRVERPAEQASQGAAGNPDPQTRAAE
jgi:cytoskeletal protein CcmA (bactofilin family)